MNKRKIYALAIMAAFNLLNRAAREHLGYHEDPMPMEVIYEGNLLNVQEALESNRIKQLELMVAMDSVLSTRPGRSNGISEIHAKRALQELKHYIHSSSSK